jgi:hypothetical protein
MSFEPPQPFRTRLEGGIGPVTVNPVTVQGIPSSYDFDINSMPVIHVAWDSLPTIHLSVDHIPKIEFAVDPMEIRLTEFPSIRAHLPADFSVGFSLLGVELGALRLCGESQVITEPYVPNPCEVCHGRAQAELRPVEALPVASAPAQPKAARKKEG